MNTQTISPIRRVASTLSRSSVGLVVMTVAACSDGPDRSMPTAIQPPVAPAFAKNVSGSNQRILFTSDRSGGGNYDIYSMNPDGTGVTQLTSSPEHDEFGTWSPDGKQIAFSSLRDAPAGEIYLMKSDGSGVVRLTFNAGNDAATSWSKDGTRIAFQSTRDALDPTLNQQDSTDVYVMNSDGTGVTRLTSTPLGNYYPMFAPDGRRIAFVSRRDHPTSGDFGSDLYVMNADGTNVTRLTFQSLEVEVPSWDPHGRRIAFSTQTGIFVIAADGSGLTQLTFGPTSMDNWPSWSSDGTKLVFTSFRDGNAEIYSMNADGTGHTRLTNSSAEEYLPRWSR